MPDSVAVLGTGAIGTAVARRLLGGGLDVVVWNRTAGRAVPLVEAGARPARSAGAAARAAPLVLLTLKDYGAVRECLAAVDGDLSGRAVVAICTGTPGDARATARQATGLGAEYVDAGLQAAPEMIGTAAATILYSGSRAAFDRHAGALGLLSTPRFVGEQPEAAAVWDLALFGLWYDAQLGVLRALDTVRAAGIDADAFAGTAGTQLGHVVAGLPATVDELRRAAYPAGPAGLAEHLEVLRHLVELRAGQRLGDGGLAAVAARIAELVADGRGGEGLTASIG